jgi:hypothetical protein
VRDRGPRPRLDLVGLPLIALGLLALVWAPVRAPSVGWGSSEVIGSLVGQARPVRGVGYPAPSGSSA